MGMILQGFSEEQYKLAMKIVKGELERPVDHVKSSGAPERKKK